LVLSFFGATRRCWWPLLLAYPLAMTFTLVYSGEHYMIDVLVGWAYVGITFLVVGLAERWWATRRARRGPAPGGPRAVTDGPAADRAPPAAGPQVGRDAAADS